MQKCLICRCSEWGLARKPPSSASSYKLSGKAARVSCTFSISPWPDRETQMSGSRLRLFKLEGWCDGHARAKPSQQNNRWEVPQGRIIAYDCPPPRNYPPGIFQTHRCPLAACSRNLVSTSISIRFSWIAWTINISDMWIQSRRFFGIIFFAFFSETLRSMRTIGRHVNGVQ